MEQQIKFSRLINYILIVNIFLFNACEEKNEYDNPRLTAQIEAPTKSVTKGITEITFSGDKYGLLYVPENYSSDVKMPLFVALHGASGSSSFWKNYYDRAEDRGFILLALDSKEYTWDAIIKGYNEDLQRIDKSLKYIFNRCYVDEESVALAGYSDGATYTLSLGPSNGDLFTHLIAYSPGYVIYAEPIVGKPKIYISHGDSDPVLSVETTRDQIVPYFSNDGYDVTYYEFRGGHTVPAFVSEQALDWFLGPIDDDVNDGDAVE